MIPQDRKTLTIARRTRKNLEFMDAQKRAGADVEEFTQLLNSLFGMLICLREDYFKGREVKWEELEAKGLPKIIVKENSRSEKKPNLKKTSNFSQLVSKMRHALAHNNFEFIGKEGQIVGLKVWNIPSNQENDAKNRTWEAQVYEAELRELAFTLIDYLETTRGHELSATQEIPS